MLSGFNQAERTAGFLAAVVEDSCAGKIERLLLSGLVQDLSAVLTIGPSTLPSVVSTSRLFCLSCVLTRSSGAVIPSPEHSDPYNCSYRDNTMQQEIHNSRCPVTTPASV